MLVADLSCPLCSSDLSELISTELKRTFFRCPLCDLISLDPSERLSLSQEKARYETHQNDLTDLRYQDFVRPLVHCVQNLIPAGARGLDFGAGTAPIAASLFQEQGFETDVFDPFFWPNPSALKRQYDFVVASEVVEHFSNPKKEFTLLKSLLKPGGVLGLMTLMHEPGTEIETWYYLKDPTHICAYSKKTFEWIREYFLFSSLDIRPPRTVILQ